MSRRRAAEKRPITPDPVFGSEVVSQFINMVMLDGKKSVAERIVYGALRLLAERKSIQLDDDGGEDGGESGRGGRAKLLALFDELLDNIAPLLEVKSRRVGGATYQVPVEVPVNRRGTLAMRWLIASASSRGEQTMMQRLAGEFMDALSGRGGAVKKREDAHRMAEANRAFVHVRV